MKVNNCKRKTSTILHLLHHGSLHLNIELILSSIDLEMHSFNSNLERNFEVTIRRCTSFLLLKRLTSTYFQAEAGFISHWVFSLFFMIECHLELSEERRCHVFFSFSKIRRHPTTWNIDFLKKEKKKNLNTLIIRKRFNLVMVSWILCCHTIHTRFLETFDQFDQRKWLFGHFFFFLSHSHTYIHIHFNRFSKEQISN